MSDFVIVAIILAILAGAAAYVIRAKKRGQKCIGCPHSKDCKSCNCGK